MRKDKQFFQKAIIWKPQSALFANFETVFADFETITADFESRDDFGGYASKPLHFAPVAAFAGQLLGGNGFLGSGSLPIETHEVVDAKIVDISIVSDALTGEILAEIEAVGTNSLSQLDKG